MTVLALLIVVGILEIYVMIQVAHVIGALDTIALLLLVSIVGAWLTKHEGFAVWRRMQTTMAEGRAPTNELIDGVLILAAGVLLLVPGFVTAGIGLLILFPPTRVVFRNFVRRRFSVRVIGGLPPTGRRGPTGPDDDIIDI